MNKSIYRTSICRSFNIAATLLVLTASSTALFAESPNNMELLEKMPYVDLEMLTGKSAENKNEASTDSTVNGNISEPANINKAPANMANNSFSSKTDSTSLQASNLQQNGVKPVVPVKIIKKQAPQFIKKIVWLVVFPEVQITQNRILAKDVMTIDSIDSQLVDKIAVYDLGLSPEAGQQKILKFQTLLSKLQMGFPLVNFKFNKNQDINISRESTHFSSQQLSEIIVKFAQQEQANNNLQIQFFKPPVEQWLPGSDWKININSLHKTANQEFGNWQLQFSNDKQLPKTLVISGRILNNNLDTTPAKNIANNNVGGSTKKNQTLSQSIINKAPPTVTVTPNLSTKKPDKNYLVTQGHLLTLQLKSPYIVINTMAIAIENGELGEFIKVKNNLNNKIITAKIVGPNQVELNY